MVRAAVANPGLRRVMARSAHELARAAETGQAVAEARVAGIEATYGASYFGEGRAASGDREGHSGYARYDRVASNADIAGWLLWRNFRVTRSLDVGCATGYLVEVLRELGIDAEGCDVSPFAIAHAAPGANGTHPGRQSVRRPSLGGRCVRTGHRPRNSRASAARPGTVRPG